MLGELKTTKIPCLQVLGLSKTYPRKKNPVIKNLNFQINRGEFHAFIGDNGAGKTTTIKIIIGAIKKFQGKILINNVDSKKPISRNKLAYIPEVAKFPVRLNTYDYLYHTALLSNLTYQQAHEFVTKMLKTFNLWNLRKYSPNNFSSGQKKKVLLAQALANDPDLIVMDEPTANLDVKSRLEFFEIIKDLLKNSDKSVFVSSHILSDLDLYANAITILDGGQIAYSNNNRNNQKFSPYTYRIIVNNPKNYPKILNYKVLNQNELIIDFQDDPKQFQEVINYLQSKRMLISCVLYRDSIEDLYKRYVKKGSNDANNA